MKLIDIVDILSNLERYKINVNGDFIETYEKRNIPLHLLTMQVTCIYSIATNDNSICKSFMVIDLTD